MTYPLPIEIQTVFYIISSALFIFGIKMLGKPKTARRGNVISSSGMLLAVITALLSKEIIHWQWIVLGIVLGSLIGAFSARLVAMTAMPEMVALFNGFGGIASLLVGWAEFDKIMRGHAGIAFTDIGIFQIAIIIITVIIGGITFTGSIVAWGKLSRVFPSKPILYRGQGITNALILGIIVLLAIIIAWRYPIFTNLLTGIGINYYILFIIIICATGVFGILSIIRIGGGDMPVVISLLNSLSGMAALAVGFVISNNVLIVSGALVGSSGIILTNIMCKAMNRSLINVLFSGFGAGVSSIEKEIQGEAKPITANATFYILEAAKSVVIVPGYGMAVAQAQHVVWELTQLMENNGTEVQYAIHPVAGRMPGHMNVLLAEANVPYEKLVEMDDINSQLGNIDVCLVIGANDVVNTSARDDETSPIRGMPIINADKAGTVLVLKRSMATGFASIQNPLFFKENTRMLFGDAKGTIAALIAEFKDMENSILATT